MTNYNGRLDEVLFETIESAATYTHNVTAEEADNIQERAKQAITSLTKEMVAEAKPGKYSSGESILNVDGIGEVDGYEGYNQAIDHFEQNLLKALEEV